ncbi:MAG: Pycsar system effector family protein [Chitinophagaceae bacterium]
MSVTELMKKAALYVRNAYSEMKKPELVYHCLAHTEHTVAAAEKIADHYQLEEEDYAAVYIAAWFHDIGYLSAPAEQHEEKGIELVSAFIRENGGNDSLVGKVEECILATKMPQNPVSLISRIVCDADLFHFGTEDFETTNKQVRKEMEARFGQKIPGKLWRIKALDILNSQKFHTDYCQALLQKGKQENVDRIKVRIEDDNSKKSKKHQDEFTDQTEALTEDSKKKPTRGVETMFRTTSTNHLRLSEMADTKANIMITVNSIIASILVSVLFRKLEDDHRLIIPAMMFLITSLVSIVFAILVTRPNVTQGTFTEEDLTKKRANLLFFGNFHKMSLSDYQRGIDAMMADSEFLYGSMTRDIYNLGVVLGRKYKLLRVAYSFFMFGFIISVLSFVIAVTMFKK